MKPRLELQVLHANSCLGWEGQMHKIYLAETLEMEMESEATKPP